MPTYDPSRIPGHVVCGDCACEVTNRQKHTRFHLNFDQLAHMFFSGPTWLNYTLNYQDSNGTDTHVSDPSMGTVNPFTPTAGNPLVVVGYGAQARQVPAGWTVVASAVNRGGLYLLTRVADGTAADQITARFKVANYPALFAWFEFNQTAIHFPSVIGATTMADADPGGTAVDFSVDTIPGEAAAFIGVFAQINTTPNQYSVEWDTGTLLENLSVGAGASVGVNFGITFQAGILTGASFAATSTQRPGLSAERITFAVG